MILGTIFIVSFALIHFASLRSFKDKYGEPNRGTAFVIAFAVSLLITWGINKTGFDFEGLFFDLGISSDLLYTILPLILLAGIIYLFYRLKTKALFIFGGLLILVSFTEMVYEKGLVLGIGVFLLLIKFLWKLVKRIFGGAKAIGRGIGWGARKGAETTKAAALKAREFRRIKDIEKAHAKALEEEARRNK
jgi:hypothetical protein